MATPAFSVRPLHFVWKIGNRKAAFKFLVQELGMKVLRHEEFTEGCRATCNGPYDGKWSKTMVGYAQESDAFVLELTYNYGISKYRLGNDFMKLEVEKNFKTIPNVDSMEGTSDGKKMGYCENYPVCVQDSKSDGKIKKIVLTTDKPNETRKYWEELLNVKMETDGDRAWTSFPSSKKSDVHDFVLEFVTLHSDTKLDRGTAYGRIAFETKLAFLHMMEAKAKKMAGKVLVHMTDLDTPGKSTVTVIILLDPNGHEICFVGEEGFGRLSKFDPKGKELLMKSMDDDKSDEWYAKMGKTKDELK